ncbi:Glutaconyl-CoA decarboxylase subunit gamma [compost metagenome]
MQGTIVKINVEPGQSVAKGDILFVLEAMKMENPLKAPFDGIVGEFDVQVGDSMAAKTVLTQVTEAVAA